jgi:hypothetical protein
MEWVTNKSNSDGGGGGKGGGQSGEASDAVVRLRGLPYECSKEDIRKFFDGEHRRFLFAFSSKSNDKVPFGPSHAAGKTQVGSRAGGARRARGFVYEQN